MHANNPTIPPAQLNPLLSSGCCLVDVREPVEHTEEHIDGAKLIPLGQLERRADEIDRDGPVVVMCRSGKRGMEALKKLEELGFRDVRNLEGGILAWKEAGHPVNKSAKKVFPLMQQVQLTIGLGVLIGATLALTVNPNWVFFCAFFGLGLTLSGSTGWCGLALLMSKMPWNHVTTTTCAIPEETA